MKATQYPGTLPISSLKPSLAALDASYLATALGFPETKLHTLLTVPTVQLANKFAASAFNKAQAYDKLKSERRNDTTKCSQSFPFMRLPPELRLQVYEVFFQDTFDDCIYKGKLDTMPRSGIQPKLSHRAALRRQIKTEMAVLQTSRTVSAEGAEITLQIADKYVKFTESSVVQLRGDYRDHKSVHGRLELCSSDCVFGRYRELLQRFYDLIVILNALRLVELAVSEDRPGEILRTAV